jgi:hypothetical protein
MLSENVNARLDKHVAHTKQANENLTNEDKNRTALGTEIVENRAETD